MNWNLVTLTSYYYLTNCLASLQTHLAHLTSSLVIVTCFSVFIFSSLEPLFFQYGVDLIIEAHEHSYERLWPVYNDTVTAHNYINPKAPVHLISGAAGCNEAFGICVNPMLGPRGRWFRYNAAVSQRRVLCSRQLIKHPNDASRARVCVCVCVCVGGGGGGGLRVGRVHRWDTGTPTLY